MGFERVRLAGLPAIFGFKWVSFYWDMPLKVNQFLTFLWFKGKKSTTIVFLNVTFLN